MVVMVNHATRFTVTIYGVKHGKFKDITVKMTAAIRNTLTAMNLNPEIIEEYLQQAGELEFVANHDRKMTSLVNSHGRDACYYIGNAVMESRDALKFEDTLGRVVSRRTVLYGTENESVPADEMVKALAELTGKPAYKYRAFELLVTLDLDIYKAMRRLIVAADTEFPTLHKLLQRVFDWKNCHLHDFTVFDGKSGEPVARLVMCEEDMAYDNEAVMETERKLSEYFPMHKHILYTYDMGDSWEHLIEFVREIEEHDGETPFLLEAEGQTPPEDVGGVPGFIEFREVMLDPNHPDHASTKEWVRYWSPELREWDTKPKVIHC
jgi:hypothetical protein